MIEEIITTIVAVAVVAALICLALVVIYQVGLLFILALAAHEYKIVLAILFIFAFLYTLAEYLADQKSSQN